MLSTVISNNLAPTYLNPKSIVNVTANPAEFIAKF